MPKLALIISLCLIFPVINASQGLITSTIPPLKTTGVIDYNSGTSHYHYVGFESSNDVQFPYPVGLASKEQQYVFQSEDSAWSVSFADNIVKRIQYPYMGVRPGSSGSYVLKERLANASTDYTRRIHIRHLWDPLTTSDIWIEFWVYLPADFQIHSWTEFFVDASEREWVNDQLVDNFAPGGASIVGTRNADGSYKLEALTAGVDGVRRIPHFHNEVSVALRTVGGIKLGQWQKIKGHVHRPLEAADPTYENAGGYWELWINDVKQEWYERDTGKSRGTTVYCRTVGDYPSELAAFPAAGDSTKGWLDNGIDLYADIGDPSKEIYYDDVVLSSTEITSQPLSAQGTLTVNATLQPMGTLMAAATMVENKDSPRISKR